MDENRREFLKALLQLAWADDELTEGEQETMADILVRMGYDPDEVEQEELSSPDVTVERLKDSLKEKWARQQVLRDLVTVAFADHDLSLQELAYLEKVAAQLELTRQDLMELVETEIRRRPV